MSKPKPGQKRLSRRVPPVAGVSKRRVPRVVLHGDRPAEDLYIEVPSAFAFKHVVDLALLHQHDHAQKEARRKGGRAPKHLAGVQAVVDELVSAHPGATVEDLWSMIPEADPDRDRLVYRDDKRVVEVDDVTGRDGDIGRRAFERYVARARVRS
jgi:hypothetical protein